LSSSSTASPTTQGTAQLRRDKRNELTLREHGLTVIRYDWLLLHREPERMYRDLISHLRRTL
jgi:hypothetical protein